MTLHKLTSGEVVKSETQIYINTKSWNEFKVIQLSLVGKHNENYKLK